MYYLFISPNGSSETFKKFIEGPKSLLIKTSLARHIGQVDIYTIDLRMQILKLLVLRKTFL